jgi:PASTA domain
MIRGSLCTLALTAALLCAADALAARPLSAPQTITVNVHAPATAAYNTAFSVFAESSSRLPVVYTSSGPCTNDGATFTMTGGSGVCQVRYDQPGGPGFAAAAQLVESVTAQKASQRITFAALPDKTYGDPEIAVVALASSGLPTTLTASGFCTVSGAIAALTGAGTCTITATQPGDSNYEAAAPASRSFTIAKASQTITFAAPAKKAFGAGPFTLSAKASSGLPVSFTASGHCSVTGSTVRLKSPGSCTVTAAQPGDADFDAAEPVSRTFAIGAACSVPNVVGKTTAAAKAALAKAHCRAGKITLAYSAKRKGVVAAQAPRPGSERPGGAKVDLVVSRGRRG